MFWVNLMIKKESVIKKILLMLKYEKYYENLLNKNIDEEYSLGSEVNLMITSLDKNYNVFVKKTLKELIVISKEIIKKYNQIN